MKTEYNILVIADLNMLHNRIWISSISANYQIYALHSGNSIYLNPISGVKLEGLMDNFSLKYPSRTLFQLWKIRGVIKKRSIGLVHIYYADPNLLWANVKPFVRNVRFIVTTRGSDVFKGLNSFNNGSSIFSKVIHKLYRKAIHNCDYVVSTSSSQVDRLREYYSWLGRSDVVYTGIDPGLYFTKRKDRKEKVIFLPRSIYPLYKHEFTIEAISLVDKELIKDYKVILIGKGVGNLDYEAVLERLLIEKEIPYQWYNWLTRKELIKIYKESEMVIMNPLWDGTPVSALEAVATDCKLILGPCNYDDELVRLADVKLESWNSKDLATGIEYLLQHENSSKQKDFIEVFNTKSQMDKMNNIYKDLLN